MTDADLLHDFYAKFHAASSKHPDEYWRNVLGQCAERIRSNLTLAREVAILARRSAKVSNPEAYAACSAAETAAVRVLDALDDQNFTGG